MHVDKDDGQRNATCICSSSYSSKPVLKLSRPCKMIPYGSNSKANSSRISTKIERDAVVVGSRHNIVKVLKSSVVLVILSTLFFHQQKLFLYQEKSLTHMYSINAAAQVTITTVDGKFGRQLNATSAWTTTRQDKQQMPSKPIHSTTQLQGNNSLPHQIKGILSRERQSGVGMISYNVTKNNSLSESFDLIVERCFPHNSKKWLLAGSQRLRNHNDRLLNNQIARSLVSLPVFNESMNPLLTDPSLVSGLLGQSLCHSESRFLSLSEDHQGKQGITKNHDISIEESNIHDKFDNRTIHFWSLRLIYLAIHIHQHYPAVSEASTRYASPCTDETRSLQIENMDYECPSTKFLVVSLGRSGLGSVMRLGMVNAFIAGVATNRTVVILNNSPVGPKFVRQPWLLASCPRRDYQCFYMPPTPCVLTQQDVQDGTHLSRIEVRQIFKVGHVPKHLMEDRILLADLVLRPQRMPPTFRPNLYRLIMTRIIHPFISQRPADDRTPLFHLAAEQVLKEEISDESKYNYVGRDSKVHHAILFYAMRPNLSSNLKINSILEDIVPDNLDYNLALGLPIRASDKCKSESECLTFEKYMTLMGRIWMNGQDEMLSYTSGANETQLTGPSNATIIVTSESQEIAAEQKKYESEGIGRHLPFAFQIVNNRYDRMQGTGDPNRMKHHIKNENFTIDDIMLSSVSSLKLQMLARHSVGNCCSNFHLLLFDFLRDGCGASKFQTSECLQDNSDPDYRLCCHWSKTDECIAKRQQDNLTRVAYRS